jgi:sugar transferase (PEP-CTERM/EpsH1 system associated)
MKARRPLILHVVHRFDTGGLENGLVNLINCLPEACGRHAVVALTECGGIVDRIERPDVTLHALQKAPGSDLRSHRTFRRLLRDLRPDIVHTRNIGTIEYQLDAWLAGVPRRIHGEHGWDTVDPDGSRRSYRFLRRVLSLGIDRFVALSGEIARWLVDEVGISQDKVVRICNGVDTLRMHPCGGLRPDTSVTVGTVTRFSSIKDPLNTARAFVDAAKRLKSMGHDVRFIMVGDGPLKGDVESYLRGADMLNTVLLPGNVLDVSVWYQQMDVFVLGSLREGISNTILEAMASGLPVIATDVGGNAELVDAGNTGTLVAPAHSSALADSIVLYACDVGLRRQHGAAGRVRAEREFSIARMVECYAELYRLTPRAA